MRRNWDNIEIYISDNENTFRYQTVMIFIFLKSPLILHHLISLSSILSYSVPVTPNTGQSLKQWNHVFHDGALSVIIQNMQQMLRVLTSICKVCRELGEENAEHYFASGFHVDLFAF